MNILYHFRTQGTGAEGVHIAGVAEAFERLGHRVTFSSPSGVDPRRAAGANPFKKGGRGLLARMAAYAPDFVFELMEVAYNFLAAARNAALLDRESAALIYERHAFFLCSTALLASRRKLPLVVEVNELAGDERIRSAPWLLPLAVKADKITFRVAACIVVVSPHLKRRIAALGVDENKILVLPNAVSPELLDAPANPAAVREKLGLHSQHVVFGFVGWFVPWHRLERLLEQFAAVTAAQPDARLLLVGDGSLGPELRALSERLGIADRVLFPGAVSHAEMPSWVEAMDVCVVPHSNEYRSPIKLFEAMARRRAVLAPATEPVKMVIEDGVNGLLFDTESAASLRAGLERLAADSALRARLGAAARESVATRHTWTQNAEAVLRRIVNDE